MICDKVLQRSLDRFGNVIIGTNNRRPAWALEIEDNLTFRPARVNMRRHVVCRKDHNAEVPKAQNRGHPASLKERAIQ